MILFLFVGMIAMVVVMFLKNKFIYGCPIKDSHLHWLQKRNRSTNYWKAGGLLFLINALLFSGVIGLLFVLMYIPIPFLHLFLMVGGVMASIYAWSAFNRAWEGSKAGRFLAGLTGSSFYLGITLFFIYQYATLEPAFEGDDMFMAAFGLMIAFTVTTVAFITCFIFTVFSAKKQSLG
ncbi:MAG: hypothetical protein LRY73_11700 [Bacillus sp. (in: Bacteria)]|nr:hypothetical protein [Bacillus sp. (in: firmicutes)]